MNIYRERAHLLALLTRLYRAVLYRPSDAEPGFTYCLSLLLPSGQGTWHIADEDLDLFRHVPQFPYTFPPREFVWDGHTTDEKYYRIRRYIESR
jgi:hypothetical protein